MFSLLFKVANVKQLFHLVASTLLKVFLSSKTQCHKVNFYDCSDIEKISESFWNEKTPYTPESRLETYEVMKLQKEGKLKPKNAENHASSESQKRKLFFAEDGRPYNINEPKYACPAFERLNK